MTIEELEAKLETVTRERDEALTEIAEWKRVTGYDDTETLDFECGRAGIRTHIDVNLRLRETANRERDEARAEVERLRVKAEAYGGMVDGCGPALEAAGHPIDPFQPDGRVGGIARSVAALIKERDEARAEVERLRAEADRWKRSCNVFRERDWPHAFQVTVTRLEREVSDAHVQLARLRRLSKPWEGDAYRRGAEAMREACQQWCRAWENDGEAIADALADLQVEDP